MKIIDKDYFVILKADIGYKLAHKDDITITYNELIMNKGQIDNYVEVLDVQYEYDEKNVEENNEELKELKEKYIYNSKIKLKEFLKRNPLEFNGHCYTITLEKQTLFYNKVSSYIAQNNLNLLFEWNAIDDTNIKWNYNEMIDFMKTMEKYINSLVLIQREYEEQIKNCKTKKEIENMKEVEYV